MKHKCQQNIQYYLIRFYRSIKPYGKTFFGRIKMSAKIEITRTFDAPRELVFKAFTKEEHL